MSNEGKGAEYWCLLNEHSKKIQKHFAEKDVVSLLEPFVTETVQDTEEIKKFLKDVFSEILNFEEFRDHLVWCNAWIRNTRYIFELNDKNPCENLKALTEDISKWPFLTSLSRVLMGTGKPDQALFIYREANEPIKEYPYIIVSQENDPSNANEERTTEEKLEEWYNQWNRAETFFDAKEDKNNDQWRYILRKGIDEISLIASRDVAEAINDGDDKAKERVIRLLNYVRWVKMTYQDWGLLVHFPGVFSKVHSSIPFGLSLGLNQQPSDDLIRLVHEAQVDVFSRMSVDWFEIFSRHQSKNAARAAIMGRNFSHNVGSHALANPNLYKSIGLENVGFETAKLRLQTFNHYMQERLDFLARAMSGGRDRPEPLFFINDV
ncbi:MAG: hypothetical protein D6732_09590, partial [Methanobacteriota archaeon]